MNFQLPITRRRFITAAGATALAAKLPATSRSAGSNEGFAFTASDRELRVYSVHGAAWAPIQALSSEAPISLLIDAHTQTLHVLHNVSEHRGLPCGYIESFRIDNHSGCLQPLSTQPLSLSAVHPRHMALSPDAKSLAVAIHGGSAYNLLPILEDGRPGRPIAIRKETGLRASPSRPAHLSFNTAGNRIFTLDQGAATLSLFSPQPELPVLSRLPLSPESAFSSAAFHADTNQLFLLDETAGSLLIVRHDPLADELSLRSSIRLDHLRGALAVDAPAQTLLVMAPEAVHRFRIVADSEPELTQTMPLPRSSGNLHAAVWNEHDRCLYIAKDNGIDRAAPGFQDSFSLAQVAPAAHAIVFYYPSRPSNPA